VAELARNRGGFEGIATNWGVTGQSASDTGMCLQAVVRW